MQAMPTSKKMKEAFFESKQAHFRVFYCRAPQQSTKKARIKVWWVKSPGTRCMYAHRAVIFKWYAQIINHKYKEKFVV